MAEVVTISKKVRKCPECGSNAILTDTSRAEIVCKSCGLVIDDNLMDFSQEWREFGGVEEVPPGELELKKVGYFGFIDEESKKESEYDFPMLIYGIRVKNWKKLVRT